MFGYAIIEFILGNAEVIALRINSLSNNVKNMMFTLLIFMLCSGQRLGYWYKWLPVCCCVGISNTPLPALTNTLFTLHPPMLYASIGLCITYVTVRSNKASVYPISVLFCSIFLGGLWSTQELSWGGWWNWDVLECGVGYIWVVYTLLTHGIKITGKTQRSCNVITVIFLFLVYTALNKYGLATSIHSFVASKSTRNHYPSISLVYFLAAVIVANIVPRKTIAYVLLLCTSYVSLSWCAFFKAPVVGLVLLMIRKPAIKNIPGLTAHKVMFYSWIALTTFNYANYPMFYTYTSKKLISQSSCKNSLWGLSVTGSVSNKFIWNELLLSKPSYFLNKCLGSYASRTLSGRFVISAFLK